ncbi:hypothetical protein N9242_05230 [Vicingaceae bacterium]|nr:hypothetical protein [Vicingaceae bacterium]
MNSKKIFVVSTVVASLLIFQGCGGAKFSTPEKAFEAFNDAGENENWKKLMSCVSEESVDEMAGGMVFMGAMSAAMSEMPGGDEKTKAAAKEIGDLLKKHGVADMKMDDMKPGSAPDPAALTKGIKNKKAFVIDMMNAMAKLGEGGPGKKMSDAFGGAKLSDVKIDGDKATGKVVDKEGDESPMNFVKEDGGWKIDMGGM